MRLHVLVVPLVFLVGTLAGCIGDGSTGSDDDPSSGDVCLPEDPLCAPPVSVEGDEKGGGAIEGFVTDEAFAPIVNAQVVVEELDLSLTTDDTGQFLFTGVPAGTYGVRAERIGYNPAKKSATVGESGAAKLEFTLKAIPTEVAYYHTQHFAGYWECNSNELNCGKPLDDTGLSDTLGRQANDAFQWSLSLDRKLAGLVAEVAWTAGPTSDKFEVSIRNDVATAESEAIGEAKGTGPLLVRIEQSMIEEVSLNEGGSVTIRVDVAPTHELQQGVGVGFAFQQAFDVYITPFYLDPAPEGFSPAADYAQNG